MTLIPLSAGVSEAALRLNDRARVGVWRIYVESEGRREERSVQVKLYGRTARARRRTRMRVKQYWAIMYPQKCHTKRLRGTEMGFVEPWIGPNCRPKFLSTGRAIRL